MPISLGQRFGAHVRSLREARRLTQEVLAERSELSVDAIRRIERGGFSPSLNTLAALSAGLDVSLGTLFSSFERGRRDEVAEVADYLTARTAREVRMAWRVVRALFDEG
jgi:transcriptional regulator with XRE-family HTH domain